MILPSLGQELRVMVIGASGGIGRALVDMFADAAQVVSLFALSRSPLKHGSTQVTHMALDIRSENSLKAARDSLSAQGPFDLIIIATGLLEGEGIAPEKSISAMSFEGFEKSFLTNTIGPAMCAKYYLPLLRRDEKAVFAALSARVGSISDNRIGGWYAYRASKTALNMIIKTLSIEHGRRFKEAVIAGLHPGTVDTNLSKPFQGNVPPGKLFTPQDAAQKLVRVIDGLTSEDTGGLFDWAGERIEF